MRELNIRIVDTPFDPNDRERIVHYYYRSKNTKYYYRIFISLTGPDVPFVKRVTYILPSSFEVRHKRVDRSWSNPNCKLAIRVWGKFEILAIIEDKKGNIYETSHYLDFDSYFDPEKFEANQLKSQVLDNP